MVKPTGPLCNLNCTYCFYLEKSSFYPNVNRWEMPENVLETFIREYIATQKTESVEFAWQGGEPTLLGVEYFEKILKFQRKYAGGKQIFNSIQTNGVLIDNRWAEFFRKNNFLVGISVDGTEKHHNAYRVFKNGSPSFYKVMKGIESLRKFKVDYNVLATVHKANVDFPLDVYKFLKKIGNGFIQFIPIVRKEEDGHKGEIQVSESTVDAEAYGDFLIKIFDEWVRKDVGQQYVQIFDVALEAWIGRNPSLCIFSETCGRALALEHNGDLYACDHYVFPENKLGNLLSDSLKDMVNSPKQREFGNNKKYKLPQKCLECEVRFVCNGGCPKNRFIDTGEEDKFLNYLCPGYKKFFKHIDPYMNFMANELKNQRPPAGIMEFLKKKGKQFPPR
jgi:uncharacterized protein